MASNEYSIRPMTRNELATVIDWAAAEGWNPGLHDADTFFAADPDGFLVGCARGSPVASISAVKYGDAFGFIGLYIVKPEQRGKGYGLRLWQAAMAALAGRTVGLDGVVAQQANYRKSGFALAYNNIRFEAAGGREPAELDPAITPLSAFSFAEIAAYDAPLFPAGRTGFLAAWLRQPHSVSLGLRLDGRLRGYGVMRRCRTGWKIGPLSADTPSGAERLFLSLSAQAGLDEPVYLDVPEPNERALELTQKHALRRVFETARMYRGPAPAMPLQRIFGVTSFELG